MHRYNNIWKHTYTHSQVAHTSTVPSHIYTNTHTHMYTYTHSFAHTYTDALIYNIYTHTHIHMYAYSHIYTCTHLSTFVRKFALVRSHPFKDTRSAQTHTRITIFANGLHSWYMQNTNSLCGPAILLLPLGLTLFPHPSPLFLHTYAHV